MFDENRRDMLRGAAAVAVHSLLAGTMPALGLAASTQPDSAAQPLTAVPPRERLLLDFGWKFFPGHACDPLHDLGFGSSQSDFAKTGAFEFATEKFDDSGWR